MKFPLLLFVGLACACGESQSVVNATVTFNPSAFPSLNGKADMTIEFIGEGAEDSVIDNGPICFTPAQEPAGAQMAYAFSSCVPSVRVIARLFQTVGDCAANPGANQPPDAAAALAQAEGDTAMICDPVLHLPQDEHTSELALVINPP